MTDNNTLEYCPVQTRHVDWKDERDTLLTQRQTFLPDMAVEPVVDTQAQHYLASVNGETAGYLRINADGHISAAATRELSSGDIAEALVRQAILDTPRRGLSRLFVEAGHPWHDTLARLGFTAGGEQQGATLSLLLPPDRSSIASGSDLVRLEHMDDFRRFSVTLAKQAVRSIIIFSDDLEAWLYDNDEFVSAVLELAQRSRNSSIRLIVRDTRMLLERGHCLLRASHRASDKIQLHKLPANLTEKLPNFMVVDDNGLLFRPDSQVVQGIGYTDYRARAKPLIEQFDQYWIRSHVDPDLRQHTI